MKYLLWLLKAAIFFTLFAFALNNQQEATVHLFFGHAWRAPMVLVVLVLVIIAISIPLSILTSLLILSALGETINIMTLGGLALAVGILGDEATVCIENTHMAASGAPWSRRWPTTPWGGWSRI